VLASKQQLELHLVQEPRPLHEVAKQHLPSEAAGEWSRARFERVAGRPCGRRVLHLTE
jgi:hypothetical protein